MPSPRPVLPSGRHPYAAVPYYDGTKLDTVRDQYGSMRGVHPNDQGMAMAMLVRRGQCKADPEAGNTLHEINDLSAMDLESQIRAHVDSAVPLSRLVSEGKVQIERIDRLVARGKLAVMVYYTNLDTGERGKVGWYT